MFKRYLSGLRRKMKTDADLSAEAMFQKMTGTKPKIISGAGYRLIEINDPEVYSAIQEQGNKDKITKIFADPENIKTLCNSIGPVGRILCHGTRNGAEQKFFKSAFPEAVVLGTEISETASEFSDTIQWDFHEIKPEWIGAWDLVYSNSWDHARDPKRAFRVWVESLAPGGILVLEHSRFHEPKYASPLDPFGATVDALKTMVFAAGGGRVSSVEVMSNLPSQASRQQFVIFKTRTP